VATALPHCSLPSWRDPELPLHRVAPFFEAPPPRPPPYTVRSICPATYSLSAAPHGGAVIPFCLISSDAVS